MSSPPEKSTSESKFFEDYKILAIFCVVTTVFGVYIYYIPPNDRVFNINYLAWLALPLSSGLYGLFIAKKYWRYEVFKKSYLSLGLGYIFYTIGVFIWEYYTITRGTVDYPGIADVAYLIYEPLVIMHLILNIKQFKQTVKPITKFGVSAIAGTIIAVFLAVVFTYNKGIVVSFSDLGFDISLVYVITAAMIFALALWGMTIFQKSSLGKTWRLLVLGIFAFTIAEVWYDYLSMYNTYTTAHPINALYMLSFMIITYSLYLHKKTL